jgi:hypothetical protein
VDNLRPEARGPFKSGAWGGRPTCHPQTPPVAIPFFNLGARSGWVVSTTPQPLYPRERNQYPFYWRLGGPMAGLDGCGEEKISYVH